MQGEETRRTWYWRSCGGGGSVLASRTAASLSSATGFLSLPLSLRFFLSFLRVALLFCFFRPFFFGFFSIYRGKVRGPMVVGSGFRGWLNHPRQPGAVFFSLSAGGRPTTSVGGPTVWGLGLFGGEVRERERREVFSKFFLSSVAGSGGKEDDEQCRSKRHRSGFFFFYIYIYMKRHRFG